MAAGKKTGGRTAGTPNRRTAAVEAAMQVVAAQFKEAVPAAFDGDGVCYLQTVYRDPAQPTELRMDAAAKAARFERPTLAAVFSRDATPVPATQAAADERIRALLQKGLGGAVTIDGVAADDSACGPESG